MLDALFRFFNVVVFSTSGENSSLDDFLDNTFTIGNLELSFLDYLNCICSLISLFFIVILCCLFVYKIIRLVGGLISR